MSIRTSHDMHPHVPWYRQLLNFLGCLAIVPLCRALAVNTRYPATVDLLVSILLAELCRFNNESRRVAFRDAQETGRHLATRDVEKLQPQTASCETVAAIVGWREDPDYWYRCLESYKTARACKFVLAGIDGNEADDQEMVEIFEKVYPEHSAIIEMDEPLGEVANAIRRREVAARLKVGDAIDDEEINEIAMQACLRIAQDKLQEEIGDLPLSGPDGIRHLLVKQRHLHKKGIMFTVFVFSIIIADILGVEIVWSSDSDTMVFEDSLKGTINAMAGDPKAGGSSSGLVIHNVGDTMVTKLASCIYWCELYLTRSMPGSMAVSDCQSGPSAAFRLTAIRPILVPWYNQRVLGKQMIVNEDRHLTTLLLLRGWGVIYAGDIMTETETPTSLVRWIRQQTRWARAQHIESLLLPRVYLVNHPFLFLSALRREVAHLVVFVQCLLYLFTDISLLSFNMPDLGLRLLGIATYNFLRNPDRQSATAVLWMVPGLLFYNVPLPAVQFWSLVTLTADSWGNSMRSSSERAKKDSMRKRWFESGFFVIWMGAVGAMLAKWVASRREMMLGETLLWEVLAAAVCGFVSWKITIQDA